MILNRYQFLHKKKHLNLNASKKSFSTEKDMDQLWELFFNDFDLNKDSFSKQVETNELTFNHFCYYITQNHLFKNNESFIVLDYDNKLITKLKALANRYNFGSLFYACLSQTKNNVIWYAYNTENIQKLDKQKLVLSQDLEIKTVDNFISWNMKLHHNYIYNNVASYLNIMEKLFDIEKSEAMDNVFISSFEESLINYYITTNSRDIIKRKKAQYINGRYLILQILCNKKHFLNILELYDKNYNQKYKKQIKRYINELVCYFRFLNIYKTLIDKKIIQNSYNIRQFKILCQVLQKTEIKPIKSLPDFITIDNLSKKNIQKIIELLNQIDDHYRHVIFTEYSQTVNLIIREIIELLKLK